MLRHKIFNLMADDNLQNIFSEITINSDEFQFDMDDIKRLRKEMRILILNLGHCYSHWGKVAQNEKVIDDATDVNQIEEKVLNSRSDLSSDESERFNGNYSGEEQSYVTTNIKQECDDS
jgi:hypothetical protein